MSILSRLKAKINCVTHQCPSTHPELGYCWTPGDPPSFRCPRDIHACLLVKLQLPAVEVVGTPNSWLSPMPIPSGCDTKHPCSNQGGSDMSKWCKGVSFELPILMEQTQQCFWRWVPPDGENIAVGGDCLPDTSEVKTVWLINTSFVHLECVIHDGIPQWRLRVFLQVEYWRCDVITCQEMIDAGGEPGNLCPSCYQAVEWTVDMYRPIDFCSCGRCPPIDNEWPLVELPPPPPATWCRCCSWDECFCEATACSDPPGCLQAEVICDGEASIHVKLDCEDCVCP